jgi:ABC-type amino acid transport substrate-binding protein
MKVTKSLIRVGTLNFVNESELDVADRFDLLFGGYHEFVYIPDNDPWQLVNGTWTGALGYLMNESIDTINIPAYITSERLDSFQFTNATVAESIVAIYAQHRNQAKFVDFKGIAASVS